MVVNGTHYLDRALYWFGYPQSVVYQDDSHGGPEANAAATISYPELTGTIRVSKTEELTAGCVVETDAGILIHRDWRDPVLEFRLSGMSRSRFVTGDPGMSMAGRPNMYRLQIDDFVKCCRSGRQPQVGVDEGLAVIRLLEELYGCRQTMPDDWYRASGVEGRTT